MRGSEASLEQRTVTTTFSAPPGQPLSYSQRNSALRRANLASDLQWKWHESALASTRVRVQKNQAGSKEQNSKVNRIHIICDNARYYRSKRVQNYLLNSEPI